jgi:hypothetical protein
MRNSHIFTAGLQTKAASTGISRDCAKKKIIYIIEEPLPNIGKNLE